MLNIIAISTTLIFKAMNIALIEAKNIKLKSIADNHPLYFRLNIEETAKKYNLQAAYVSAIIKNESSFRTDVRSKVGALGLMQLMPDTAKWISSKLNDKNYSFENLADAEKNIEYGCWYLNFLSNRFGGNTILTTAAYHAGQGTVSNWLNDKNISADGKTIELDNLPNGPTKKYVRRVLDSYAVYALVHFKNN